MSAKINKILANEDLVHIILGDNMTNKGGITPESSVLTIVASVKEKKKEKGKSFIHYGISFKKPGIQHVKSRGVWSAYERFSDNFGNFNIDTEEYLSISGDSRMSLTFFVMLHLIRRIENNEELLFLGKDDNKDNVRFKTFIFNFFAMLSEQINNQKATDA